MSDLNKAFSFDNLIRAWRWLNTNPSIKYKNYFRDSYTSYAFNENENIKDLSERLKKRTYMPNEPSLLLNPKSLCTTRPITLLNIEDQIVYQAMINIIAEKGYNKLKKRYYNTTFGNLYSGKNQIVFYRNWKKSYRLFNQKIKSYYDSGKTCIASFDLASCYDSIDHKVLGYRLYQYNLDNEFIDFLLNLLTHWSTNKQIFKSHGIPQGPLSSGLLSEVMLSYFDEEYEKLKHDSVEYLRYVDDIILMGTSKEELTFVLATLDYRSKLIGLFPQSSKIKVRKISRIEDEVNLVSDLETEILSSKIIKKYNKLEKAFKNTYKRDKITCKTEFKMLLPNMKSSSSTANLAIDLLIENPQYFDTVGYYLSNYERVIPSSVIDKIIKLLDSVETYQVTKAVLIDSVYSNLRENDINRFDDAINRLLKNRRYSNPYLSFIILKYMLSKRRLKYSELINSLNNLKSWWVKKSILKYINIDEYGIYSYYEILKDYMSSSNIDCVLEAGKYVIENNIDFVLPSDGLNYMATKMLRTNGILNKAKTRPSFIPNCLKIITNQKMNDFNWKSILSQKHNIIENKFVRARTYFTSDVNAFINIFDTINDLLLNELSKHDNYIGSYQLGNIGGYLNSGSKLSIKYPKFYLMCKEIHEKRLECDLSHALIKKTKKPTKYIPYRYKYVASKFIYEGMKEFTSYW